MSKKSLNLNNAVSNHQSNQGLVGWWLSFGDRVGGPNYWDISQYRNHAKIIAYVPPTGPGHVVDNTSTKFGAIKSDGLNTDGAEVNSGLVPMALNGPLTVSCWVQNFATGDAQFLTLGDSVDAGTGLRYSRVQRNAYGATIVNAPLSTSPGMYHYLYTQDISNRWLYINGSLYAYASGGSLDSVAFSRLWFCKNTFIGGTEPTPAGDLVGDVRIKSSATTATEALFLYKQRLKSYSDLLSYRSWVSLAVNSKTSVSINAYGCWASGAAPGCPGPRCSGT
jgi:hypothetical protein